MAGLQGKLLLCAAVVVTQAADHWVNITSNGVTRPTLLHVPPVCEQKTGDTCRFLGCNSGTCSGFPSYECICDDGMCGVGGQCSQHGEVKLPLVVSFHPMGMTPGEWAPQQGMSTEADKRGFIVAYPQGLEPAETVSALIPLWPKHWLEGGHTWNAGSCCPGASRKKTDDVQFTRDLLDQLKGGLVKKVSSNAIDIDPQRVYACGGSNGAFLSLRLACEAPELFAAIVPVAGVLANQSSEEYPFHDPEWPMNPFACAQPRRPVPTLIFQGDEDILVPWIGEPVMGFRTPEDNVRVMKGLNGIPEDSSGTVSYEHGNGACTTYGDVATNVTICRMHKMGHAWPTNTVICKATEYVPGSFCETDIDATEQAWAFFEKYKLESSSSSSEDIVV